MARSKPCINQIADCLSCAHYKNNRNCYNWPIMVTCPKCRTEVSAVSFAHNPKSGIIHVARVRNCSNCGASLSRLPSA